MKRLSILFMLALGACAGKRARQDTSNETPLPEADLAEKGEGPERSSQADAFVPPVQTQHRADANDATNEMPAGQAHAGGSGSAEEPQPQAQKAPRQNQPSTGAARPESTGTASESGGCLSSPVKRRIVVSFNGDSDSAVLAGDLRNIDTGLARGSDRHFILEPEKADGVHSFGSGLGEDARRKRFGATPAGLMAVTKAIREDIKKNHNGDPSQYEVVFAVTNHGAKYVPGDENDPATFGISADPAAGSGNDVINSVTLSRFAGALPAGIRFKTLMSQCYGGTTQQTLLDSLPPSTMACGAALSSPRSVATDNDSSNDWLGEISRVTASEHTSIFEANLRALELGVPAGKLNGGSNALATRAEQIAYNWIAQSRAARKASVKDGDWNTLDDHSGAILAYAKSQADVRENAKKTLAAVQAIRAHHKNGSGNYSLNLKARGEIEEAFLRLAPADEVARYLEARRCELECLGPGPQRAKEGESDGAGGNH